MLLNLNSSRVTSPIPHVPIPRTTTPLSIGDTYIYNIVQYLHSAKNSNLLDSF